MPHKKIDRYDEGLLVLVQKNYHCAGALFFTKKEYFLLQSLISSGYALYTQISLDQPPLVPHLMTMCIHLNYTIHIVGFKVSDIDDDQQE